MPLIKWLSNQKCDASGDGARFRGLSGLIVAGCLAIFLVGMNMPAQTQPDAAAILASVAKTYGPVSEYELEFEASGDSASPATYEITHIAFRSPNQYRVELASQLRTPEKDGSASLTSVMVFDGSRWWGYRPSLKLYRTETEDVSHLDADALGIGSYRDPLGGFKRRGGQAMRFLKVDRLSAGDGKSHDCFVVELDFREGTNRLWIEKGTYFVLRSEQPGGSIISYRKIELNKHLSQETFRFTPPPGAQKAERPQ